MPSLQAFINPLLERGGVGEIRILNLGNEQLIDDIIDELRLILEFRNIVKVEASSLIKNNGSFTEVLVFINTSYKSLEHFIPVAFTLLRLVFEEAVSSEVETLHAVFGDNLRGLLQKNYLDKLHKETNSTLKLETVALSSIFRVSSSFNSEVNSSQIRMYPKADGSFYSYDPTMKMTVQEFQAISEELQFKIEAAEKIFPGKSAYHYPNIEGCSLSRFVQTFVQNGDWETACSNEGLVARLPLPEEIEFYGLADSTSTCSIFLPPKPDEDEQAEKLPDSVKKHVMELAGFVSTQIKQYDRL